jgi:hypothetical protein
MERYEMAFQKRSIRACVRIDWNAASYGSKSKGEGSMKKTVKYCSYLIATMLICFSADAATQVTEGETGVGAKYQITMPDNWNGDLVVYAHGFVDSALPIVLSTNDDIVVLQDMLTDSGYAVTYSSYSENGFAVREGVLDTHALNHQFIQRYGQPEKTFLVGHSLGGAVCVSLAESHPRKYDGVLTVAGMIGGSQV